MYLCVNMHAQSNLLPTSWHCNDDVVRLWSLYGSVGGMLSSQQVRGSDLLDLSKHTFHCVISEEDPWQRSFLVFDKYYYHRGEEMYLFFKMIRSTRYVSMYLVP